MKDEPRGKKKNKSGKNAATQILKKIRKTLDDAVVDGVLSLM